MKHKSFITFYKFSVTGFMKNLAKKGMALGLIAAMLCATTVTAATNRAGSIVSSGSVSMNTDIGTATIDADDIYENAVAIDNIDSQLAGLYFKYQDGYYWASKDSGNTWEKIGAVGNAKPWMVLSNDGTKNITFSSESGVDISGTMANKSGTTVTATTGAQSGNYLALTVPNTGYYDTTSKVQYALSSLGTVPANYVLKDQTFTSSAGVKASGTMANYGSGTEYIASSGTTKNIGSTSYLSLAVPATGYYTTSSRINYALSHFGSAAKSEVLNGKTFTSTAGISVSGSMANKSGTTVAASTLSSIAASGVNYLGVTIPSAGYYDTTSKLRTSVKYNPSGTITKPSTAPSYTEYSAAGNYTNTSYDLTLASGTQITLPAGYYDNSINVYSKGSQGNLTVTTLTDSYSIDSYSFSSTWNNYDYFIILVWLDGDSAYYWTDKVDLTEYWRGGSRTEQSGTNEPFLTMLVKANSASASIGFRGTIATELRHKIAVCGLKFS